MSRLFTDEDGMTSVEYAFLLALVSIVAVTAWAMLGSHVSMSAETSARMTPDFPATGDSR